MSLLRNFKYFKIKPNSDLSISKLALKRFCSDNVLLSRSENSNPLGSVRLGQPTPITHPHLLNNDDLAVGITKGEFQYRRTDLMNSIQRFAEEHSVNKGQHNTNHLVIIPSATKQYMSDKIPYVFRQNSDFLYLSGCLEPDTVLVLSIDSNNNGKSTLFMRPKDKQAELWDGPRTGVDNALDLFGVDEVYSVNQFKQELKRIIASDKPAIWYNSFNAIKPQINDDILEAVGNAPLLNSPANLIQSLRLLKSEAEQELMRTTCRIAAHTINDVMLEALPGHTEHQIYAMVDYGCRRRNASYLAYPPVVASGSNATIIHYINNSQKTKNGDMILMDAGCEYGGYTSDITRTWPINGKFTIEQKILYDIVLTLQKELIGTVLKEGGETLDFLFDTMCLRLGKYLREVGLISKSVTTNLELARMAYKFCPHHVSHYLGMDVHDTPLMSRSVRLIPGMVCTIEPGIYISEERTDVPKEFRGLGVRIEDDILITSNNQVEVLSADCVKEHHDLENIFTERKIQNLNNPNKKVFY